MHDLIFFAIVAEISRTVCRFSCWLFTGIFSLLQKLFGWAVDKIFRDSQVSKDPQDHPHDPLR